jgi:hypothetical protein
MSAWLTEFKKDLRLMRAFALISILIAAIIGVSLVVWGYQSQSGIGSMVGISLMFAMFSLELFYLPVHVLINLNQEWRRTASFWLQSPQSGWRLLAAKVTSGLVWLLVLLLVTLAFGFWDFHTVLMHQEKFSIPSELLPWIQQHQVMLTVYAVVSAVAVSFYLGLWMTLISVSMRSFRNRFKGGPWLIGIAVFLIMAWGMNWLTSTSLYHQVFDFGRVNLLQIGLGQPFVLPSGVHVPFVDFYVGHFIFSGLVMAAIFLISARLLDRNVEV